MRIVITAGGTREPIDAVRYIGNTSTGALGVELAAAARAAGHEPLLIRARTAHAAPEGVASVDFVTSADLAARLDEHVPGADVVIHAAAVADYLPVASSGKISSDRDELVLRMTRAPKLIDRLRARAPGAVLVGFKLTSGTPFDERVAIARRLLERASLDLVVVNDTEALGPDDHDAAIVSRAEIVARCRGKRDVAQALIGAVTGAAAGSGGRP